MKIFNLKVALIIAAFAGALPAAGLAAESSTPISVLSALYGARNERNPINFTLRLQQTCGESSTYCEAFCSDAFAGAASSYHRIGYHPICRVVYRCGAETTQTAEADKNETVTLICRPLR